MYPEYFEARERALLGERFDALFSASEAPARGLTVNGLLDWDDTVLLISQGDTAIRWNYYGFELNATLARGFGGFGYGHEGDYNWDTTHTVSYTHLTLPTNSLV